MAEQLNEGDLVRLKTGGHVMTIGTIETADDGSKIASCIWFADGRRKQERFELDNLVKE